MLNQSNYKAARKTLNIMILLYKKRVWNDDKAVNAIAQACYSNDRKISYAACKFFLSEYEEVDEEDSENNEMDDLKNKYKLLGKGNNKKTKRKKQDLKKLMKAVERRENRKTKIKENKDFMPIDLLNDPTQICEKMYDKLIHVKNKQNTSLKVALIRLIGRLAGRHKIIIPHYFNFAATLVRPKQEHISTIFASIIEATHHLVPPSELEPVVNEIFDKFVDSSFPPQYVTIGVNALKELVERSPHCIKYDHYTIVEDLKRVKNKSVSTAVRAFINMVRDVLPELMDNKVGDDQTYGINQASDTIEGLDLLKVYEGMPADYKMECNQLLTDKQLKKLKLLKLKENAEAVQRIRLNLKNSDVNEMLGDAPIKEKKSKKIVSSKKEEEDDDKDNNLQSDDEEDDGDAFDADGESIEDDEDDEDYEAEEDVEDADEEEEDEDDDDEEVEDDGDELAEISEAESYHSEGEDPQKDLKELLESEKSGSENIEDDNDDEEESNSFIDENQINTYKKRYNEVRDDLKHEAKEEYINKRKKKTKGQQTNFDARKNKPTQMIIHKIKRDKTKKACDKNLAHRIKNIKRQLGRFKRGNMVLKKKGQESKQAKKKLSKRKKNKKI